MRKDRSELVSIALLGILVAAVAARFALSDGLRFHTPALASKLQSTCAKTLSIREGDPCTFAMAEFRTIDGFEKYGEEDRIFETWIDGRTNETGATIGYMDAPFVERTIVHGGRQSVPLRYDNRAAPFHSEAERDFDSVDWASCGADTLQLFVVGQAPAFLERQDGTILMNGIGSQFGIRWNGDRDEFRYAYRELVGDGSITVRVDAVVHTNESAMAGVMIRGSLHASAWHATVAVAANGDVFFQRRRMADSISGLIHEPDVGIPHWMRLSRKGNTFTAERSEDGIHWVSVDNDPAGSTVEISMPARVFIGLAVTSQDARAAASAAFSQLSTAGNISGSWQTTGVGTAQVAGNTIDPLYVAVEDCTGSAAVVPHPDPAVVCRATWQPWRIPLRNFDDVDMTHIATLYVGVGSRGNATAGGVGMIFIDDIGIGWSGAGQPTDRTVSPEQ